MTSHYVIEYEACALLFLIVVTFRFYGIHKYPSKLNRLFGAFLHFAIVDLVLDIVSAYLIMYADNVPLWLNFMTNASFYAMQVTLPALALIYVFHMCGIEGKFIHLSLIPVSLCYVLLFTNPFTEIIFTFSGTPGGLVFTHGSLFFVLYVTCAIYMVLIVATVLKNNRILKKTEVYTIISFAEIVVAAIILQNIFTNVMLMGVAISVSITMMFFTMQNPEAMLDITSGVFNYSTLYEYLRIQVAGKNRLWITAVDIGGIRGVNESHGLRAGNDVLKKAGTFFNRMCYNRAMAFHMIGTRFLIVTENKNTHMDVVGRISKRFAEPWTYGGADIYLIATVRYIDRETAFTSPEDVMNLIDLAYSKITADDAGNTRPIGSSLLGESRRITLVENALRIAVDSGNGFVLNYQPIYSISENAYHSAEALLRLYDPHLGAISPAEFIPIAEKIGLISKIDNIVIDAACEFLKRHPELRQLGFRFLEVNLSAAEFHHSSKTFADDILKKLDSIENMICFEVTETAATTHREILSSFMEKLIEHGVIFAIDDFGTGFANITQLAKLPFSIAKIDRAFIMSEQVKEKIIVEDIVKMFGDIGLETVIEGAETEGQAQFAKKIGADSIQGFYYSYPLEEEDFMNFLYRSKCRHQAVLAAEI